MPGESEMKGTRFVFYAPLKYEFIYVMNDIISNPASVTCGCYGGDRKGCRSEVLCGQGGCRFEWWLWIRVPASAVSPGDLLPLRAGG